MKILLSATCGVVMLLAVPAFAGGNGNEVTQGNNHGAAASEAAHTLGGVGGAIGGKGASDGDATNGQAHGSAPCCGAVDRNENGKFSRGENVQGFIGNNFGIGSQQ